MGVGVGRVGWSMDYRVFHVDLSLEIIMVAMTKMIKILPQRDRPKYDSLLDNSLIFLFLFKVRQLYFVFALPTE